MFGRYCNLWRNLRESLSIKRSFQTSEEKLGKNLFGGGIDKPKTVNKSRNFKLRKNNLNENLITVFTGFITFHKLFI